MTAQQNAPLAAPPYPGPAPQSSRPEQLSAVDLVAGYPVGAVSRATVLAEARGPTGSLPGHQQLATDPWTALELATLPALERTPCVVAFSGGRDSSLVLAAASSAARRWGLAPPVPATLCFQSAASDEAKWQASVLRHLRIADWQRLRLTDELDFLGAIAQEQLTTWGLRYPANAHSMVPVLQEARGGALLTGLGGDDILGSWRWAGRSRLRPRRRAGALSAATLTVVGTFPRPVRRAVLAERLRRQMSREKRGYSWLTPKGRGVALAALVDADDQPTA